MYGVFPLATEYFGDSPANVTVFRPTLIRAIAHSTTSIDFKGFSAGDTDNRHDRNGNVIRASMRSRSVKTVSFKD